ncbi:MAG: hypothetical protein GTN69_08855, partial [Armatimonadetes bacterium]|nr:hypothetical protein [Armatimonadota bacterium]NIO75973.1 hypothetical protein [Armatimonadota bacterium]
MRTYGWSLLVVVIVIVGLLAVPATREVVRVEGSAFCPFAPLHNLYCAEVFTTERPSGLDLDQLATQARAEHPKDWKTVMGAGLLAEDEQKKLAYLEEAAQLAPDEPAALFTLASARIERLSWDRKERFQWSRKEIPPDFEEELLTAEDAGLARQILEHLRNADPDNAVPEALLAWLDLGQRQDTQALALLKEAVAQPRWDIHEGTLLQAKIQVLTD